MSISQREQGQTLVTRLFYIMATRPEWEPEWWTMKELDATYGKKYGSILKRNVFALLKTHPMVEWDTTIQLPKIGKPGKPTTNRFRLRKNWDTLEKLRRLFNDYPTQTTDGSPNWFSFASSAYACSINDIDKEQFYAKLSEDMVKSIIRPRNKREEEAVTLLGGQNQAWMTQYLLEGYPEIIEAYIKQPSRFKEFFSLLGSIADADTRQTPDERLNNKMKYSIIIADAFRFNAAMNVFINHFNHHQNLQSFATSPAATASLSRVHKELNNFETNVIVYNYMDKTLKEMDDMTEHEPELAQKYAKWRSDFMARSKENIHQKNTIKGRTE